MSLVLLSGCMTHNGNHQPSVEPFANFSYKIDGGSSQRPENASWWNSFERPALNALIDQSLLENYDLVGAVAVLKQADLLAKQTKTERLPQLDGQGSVDFDDDNRQFQNGDTAFGAVLSWEVDIWNRIGAAARADKLEALARFEDVETVKLALSADVTNAYFGAVSAQQTINLLQDQLRLDRDLQNLLQLRLDNGVGTSVDVLQQKARVADSETLIPLAQSNLAVFENRLDVLLGQMPDGKRRVSATETLRFTDDLPAISVPAALLLNRPDLRSARATLIAADADIAAAIADRLPRISLTGSFLLGDDTNYTSPVSAVTGLFVQPLLDWGQRKAEVKRNKALYEERLAAYTQLFLEAVEDVENALIREKKQREFLTKLKAQKNILQDTVNASEDRYTQGIDDYLPVINALQELRDVERNLITEQFNLINIRINLFRAIGGPVTAPHKKEPLNETL